jgi:hypothetical protein
MVQAQVFQKISYTLNAKAKKNLFI